MRPSSHSGKGAYCACFGGSRSQRVTSSENAASCSSVSRICSRLVRAGNRTAVLIWSAHYGTLVHGVKGEPGTVRADGVAMEERSETTRETARRAGEKGD